jgi:uncharacterized glyoxalase superfamily protein PhnB
MQLHPYLTFNGDCEEAFKFYEQCLGAEIESMRTHAGTRHACRSIRDTWMIHCERQL